MFVKEVTLDDCISGDLCLCHYGARFFPPNLKRMYGCLQMKLPIRNRKMLVCLRRNTCIKNRLSINGKKYLRLKVQVATSVACSEWTLIADVNSLETQLSVWTRSLLIILIITTITITTIIITIILIITTIITIIITNISSRANNHSSPLCSQRKFSQLPRGFSITTTTATLDPKCTYIPTRVVFLVTIVTKTPVKVHCCHLLFHIRPLEKFTTPSPAINVTLPPRRV